MKKDPLIQFSGKYIIRERIIFICQKRYKVFPYIDFESPINYSISFKYPFFKKFRYSDSDIINWKTRDCIEMKLDNGKNIRQWYYDKGPAGYGSSTNAERALSDLRMSFEIL